MVSKNLSVCLLPNSTPIISGLAKKNGLNFFKTCTAKTHVSKIFIYPKVDGRARAEVINSSPLLNFI